MIRAFGMWGRRMTKYYPQSSMRGMATNAMFAAGKKKTPKKKSTPNASTSTWGGGGGV